MQGHGLKPPEMDEVGHLFKKNLFIILPSGTISPEIVGNNLGEYRLTKG